MRVCIHQSQQKNREITTTKSFALTLSRKGKIYQIERVVPSRFLAFILPSLMYALDSFDSLESAALGVMTLHKYSLLTKAYYLLTGYVDTPFLLLQPIVVQTHVPLVSMYELFSLPQFVHLDFNKCSYQ